MRHDVTSIQNDAACLTRVKHAVTYGRVLLTHHARVEARNAQVQACDIERAIRTATVAIDCGDRIRLGGGTDRDDMDLVVIVREIQQGLLVITVF